MHKFIYITRSPCHALLWHSVVTWMRKISVPENQGFDTIICDQGYNYSFITIHNTASKIHISYSEIHDSILFFYYLFMSPLPTLTHTIAKGSAFRMLFFMLQNYKKNCLEVSSTGSFPFPMSIDTHIHIPQHPYSDGDSTWI